jgi:hypothetical protein
MKTFGVELSLIPADGSIYVGSAGMKTAHKLSNILKKEFNKFDKKFNKTNNIWGQPFALTSKIDTFRSPIDGNEESRQWHIELINLNRTHFIKRYSSGPSLESENEAEYLRGIFEICQKFGLTTKIQPKLDKKKNQLIYHPTGGFHIHLGMDLFPAGKNFLSLLDRFNKNLWTDYCNRPYIKWLFDEWFDNHNSMIGVNHSDLVEIENGNLDHLDLQTCKFAINPRYQHNGKPLYPTFEFRFFDSPSTVSEFFENIDFIDKWTEYHIGLIEANVSPLAFILDDKRLESFSDLDKTWTEISLFLETLKLKPEIYKPRFDTNYSNRVKVGLFSDYIKPVPRVTLNCKYVVGVEIGPESS